MSGSVVRGVCALLRCYQLALSPWIGPACRFQPTCSQFAIEAVRELGVARGSWLALRRLTRCHPLGGSGYDPLTNWLADGP